MVMLFFITGSNGIYAGEDLKATLSQPASNGSWNKESNLYTWGKSFDNLMTIFTGLEGQMGNYVELKFTTSGYKANCPYRVCFMSGNTLLAQISFYSEGNESLVFAKRDELKDKDLSKVDRILFGGASASGSITLDPASIVLVGQSKITVSSSNDAKGTVYFTVGNDATQYQSATVPNHTNVKFYAKPNTNNVIFTGWGGDGSGRYKNPSEVTVTKDLKFIANFADGIPIKCTVEPNGAAEPVVYQKGHPEWGLPDDGYVGPGQATTFGFKNQQGKYKFDGWYDETGKELTKKKTYTVDQINEETKVIAKFSPDIKEINEERTITVDGKTRKYWLYVPATLEGKEKVPVVFSLHGRGNNDKPDDKGKPIFTSLAKEKNFIVVYPQGRDGGSEKADWNNGFVGTTGWEATGKENADTKFIKALVDKIQTDCKTKNAAYNNISVDPTKVLPLWILHGRHDDIRLCESAQWHICGIRFMRRLPSQ